MQPPTYIDGAKVIKWAWSGSQPFGFVGNEDRSERVEIYGLAICKYEHCNKGIYRFSCDKNWETVQDGFYGTVENAMQQLPAQYKNVDAVWNLM
jgi:hypothetical protein